jgi:hypothetical protein
LSQKQNKIKIKTYCVPTIPSNAMKPNLRHTTAFTEIPKSVGYASGICMLALDQVSTAGRSFEKPWGDVSAARMLRRSTFAYNGSSSMSCLILRTKSAVLSNSPKD